MLLPVFYALVPLLLINRPLTGIVITEAVQVVYIAITLLRRPHDMWALEIVNSVIFSTTGLVIGYNMTRVRLERYLFERDSRELLLLRSQDALTDQLTGLSNRRAFYEDLDEAAKDRDLVILSVDVNGLKQVNDAWGHAAGDELIRGAAAVLQETFGSLGRVYRIGGDEFLVLLKVSPEATQPLLEKLKAGQRTWHSEYPVSLSLSLGCVSRREQPELEPEVLIQLADQRMYAEKADWHRRHKEAAEAAE